MANYLPVLLVSVSTNAVPDDSSLSTLPRGQVDYLSHDWEEEDVWRSWRNMTRQKNEIANGARLENASWRTWWKQRNKLKTVSPETLNWLKDSDVTWLYGPLHTAVEWTPPPKPQPVPDTVEPANPASAHDRLDLSSSSAQGSPTPRCAPRLVPHKPILKHRSISELLTSDFPPSPIFSPVESEDEAENDDELTKTNTSANGVDPTSLISNSQFGGKRPTLTHTKSDTHITRWGASRAFRKDSPPRIDPPGFVSTQSQSHAEGYFPPSASTSVSSSLSHQSGSWSIRPSLSQDSNSSGSGGTGNTSGGVDSRPHHGNSNAQGQQKKKHISFNTFVEQCIAIEKPKSKNASGFFGASAAEEGGWLGAGVGGGRAVGWVDDDGYEEDQEDSEGDEEPRVPGPSQPHLQWDTRPVIHRDSDSPSPIDEEDEDEEDDDEGIIEMRSSSSSSTYRNGTLTPKPPPTPNPRRLPKAGQTPKKQPRSQSKASTASSSSSTSTSTTNSLSSGTNSSSTRGTSTSSPSGSLSPSRRSKAPSSTTSTMRKSSASESTYRPSSYRSHRGGPPPLIRTLSDNAHNHVTIAPIAPTILKTTGAWEEGFGDEGASDDGTGFGLGSWGSGGLGEKRSHGRGTRSPGEYTAGGGGYGSFGAHRGAARSFNIDVGRGRGNGGNSESDGTPVELVYVPPFGSNYSLGPGEPEAEYDEYGMQYGYGFEDDYQEEEVEYAGVKLREEEEQEEDGDERHRAEGLEQEVEAFEEDGMKVVYHQPPSARPTASVGFGGPSTSSSSSLASAVPISITNTVPTVVIDPSMNPSASTSASENTPSAYRGARPIPQSQRPDVEEEDAYDFFGGPDLGEDYYYARRGGRGYERERERPALAVAAVPVSGGLRSDRGGGERESHRDRDNRDRGSDRRHPRGGGMGIGPAGEERQSRSRSRSQSRTPSPAFIVSPSIAGQQLPSVNGTSQNQSQARKRSASASSPSGPASWITANANANANIPTSSPSSDLLSPPTRGRQPEGSGSSGRTQPAIQGQSQSQSQSRGRSSTRTSSSSSWERGSGSLGSSTSPIGSLSPDGIGRSTSSGGMGAIGIGAVLGGAAVLAGGGRVERDKQREKEREKERGRERRGRDRTSGKMLSASETESLGCDEPSSVGIGVLGAESASPSGTSTSMSSSSRTAGTGSTMDASFYSTTTSSSCSSTNTSASNSTVVPPTVVPAGGENGPEEDDSMMDVELRYLRQAEEEQRRRTPPTPSSSPVVEIKRIPAVDDKPRSKTSSLTTTGSVGSGDATPTGGGTTSPPSGLSVHTSNSVPPPPTPNRTPSPSSRTNTHTHMRTPSSGISASQPPLASPSPSKLRPPPLIPSPSLPAKPSTSFTAVTSPRTALSPSRSGGGGGGGGVGGSLASPASSNSHPHSNSPSPPPTAGHGDTTIVAKAVDIVSSAGAFLGLWGREPGPAEAH